MLRGTAEKQCQQSLDAQRRFWGSAFDQRSAFDTRRRGRGLPAFINIYLMTPGQIKKKKKKKSQKKG